DDRFFRVPGPASVARMYDYYLGGKDNYEVDREAAERVLAQAPWIRPVARHNRHFLARAVHHCVSSGIRQVIDIGTGFPTSPSPWEVAWTVEPDTRVIGVDNDKTVLAHARAHAHQAQIVYGDLRDPDAITDVLDEKGLVDWSQPVALTLVAVLHFLTDHDDPAGCIRAFRTRMAPGSRLVISHISRDGTSADVIGTIEQEYRRNAAAPLVFRTNKEIQALFDGFTLEDPGLVPVEKWRPHPVFTPDLSDLDAAATATLVQGVGAVGVLETTPEAV
ncbi:MAG: SAM-dependent methyltransferase, partial [Actinomadura rubrobrunea]|nr:SAM-dependent methyltransferase [Actinomadura rubrobrunea]